MNQTLRRGDRGPEVERLQKLLNQRMKPSMHLGPDGEFGARTERAVSTFQAQIGLGIDGVAGRQTWAALESGRAVAKEPIPMPIATGSAPWVAVATKEIGQREIAGAQHNPRIVQYHASTKLRAGSDETAWCSSFVNWCLKEAGIRGTDSASAVSWLRWGVSTIPKSGAIAVIYNAKAAASLSASGNHVGFLVQDTGTHFKLLGGNQSNRVRVSSFPKSSWTLKGYRWPSVDSAIKSA